MADLDEPNAELRIQDVPQRKPGRNAPCWCGSGKRYKACHEEVDRFIRSLPKMSAILIEIATPLMSPERTRYETHAILSLAALAWNLTRIEGSWREERMEKARRMLTKDGLRLLPFLMERAGRWPEDKRIVHNVEVVEKPDDSYDVNVAAILPPEWDVPPSPPARRPKPG